jgi:alcohol dehydrogenase class IV
LLKDELERKTARLQQLEGWQESDSYVRNSGAGIEDAGRYEAANDKDSKEMADAAYQTITTLNEMLEQKKQQVRSKEEQIDRLREQMADQRVIHADQCMKL